MHHITVAFKDAAALAIINHPIHLVFLCLGSFLFAVYLHFLRVLSIAFAINAIFNAISSTTGKLSMKKLWPFLGLALLLASYNLSANKLSQLSESSNLDKGFIGIIYDKQADKVYLKIDNLGQDFIYTTSLATGLGIKASGLERGHLSNPRIVEFERTGNRVFLKQKNTHFRTQTPNKQQRKVLQDSYASSIIWSFPIVDSSDDWVLVDASDFIYQDIHGVAEALELTQQVNDYQVDQSRSSIYMPRTTAFADNTELEATVTFVSQHANASLKPVVVNPKAVTLKLHHSFVRLPLFGYSSRRHLPKCGYFSVSSQDYAKPFAANIEQRFILRHRLKKKQPSSKVSEPTKPIVFYIESSIPEPIKSAISEGVLWWNQGFEALGYKNALQVKTLPLAADPMDARYNTIQWLYTDQAGHSYNQRVIDPRTGEIIKSRVVLDALAFRQSYLMAQGMLSAFIPNDKKTVLTDFALANLRQSVAHAIGHALGINHNTGASSYLRQSVMNPLSPQFQIKEGKLAMPNRYDIGIKNWDKAAIAYGYSQFSKDDEVVALQQLILENDKHRLSAQLANPISQLQGIINARRIAINALGFRNMLQDQEWSDLNQLLSPVYYSHRHQIEAVAQLVGSLEYDYSSNPANLVHQATSGEKQHQAITALLKTLSPDFLILPNKLTKQLVPKTSHDYSHMKGHTGMILDQVTLAEVAAQYTLNALFQPERIAKLIQQNAQDPMVPSVDDLAIEIHQSVIEKSYEGMQAIIHQAVVAQVYSSYLNLLQSHEASAQVKMQIFGVLLKVKDYLQRKLVSVRKTSSYYGFYAYQLRRLESLSVDSDAVLISSSVLLDGHQ